MARRRVGVKACAEGSDRSRARCDQRDRRTARWPSGRAQPWQQRHAAHGTGTDLTVADELEYRLRARVALFARPEPLVTRHSAAVTPERRGRREPAVGVAPPERPPGVA